MTSAEVKKHFGGIRATAAALRITYEAVRKWGDYPPLGRQYQIQALTKGRLKADPETEKAGNCK